MKAITCVILLMIFLNNCHSQQSVEKEKKSYYDTINLPMPKLTKEDLATEKDFQHCIDLTKDGYNVVLSGKKYFQSNEQKLTSFINTKKPAITKTILSIISDSKTPYEKILTVIEMMAEYKIDNYKIVSTDGQFSPVTPVIVPTTKPAIRDIDLKDSTVFIISVLADTMKVSFLNKANIYFSLTDLENFILNNKNVIDPQKVVVTASGNSKYAEIGPVLDLLLKHNYNDYRLVAVE